MILTDTSVLIDYFRGVKNKSAAKFREVLEQDIPFGITSFIFQELLQGAKTEKEYRLLKKYLSTQRFFQPKDPVNSYAQAAKIYFDCRKRGITIRSSVDCLIAQISIEHNLLLLHNDRDFVLMKELVDLKFY